MNASLESVKIDFVFDYCFSHFSNLYYLNKLESDLKLFPVAFWVRLKRTQVYEVIFPSFIYSIPIASTVGKLYRFPTVGKKITIVGSIKFQMKGQDFFFLFSLLFPICPWSLAPLDRITAVNTKDNDNLPLSRHHRNGPSSVDKPRC